MSLQTITQLAPGLQSVIALEDGNLITGTSQDCTAIAERTQAMSRSGYQGPSSEMKLAGSVPFVFVEKYLADNALTMRELMINKDHIKRLLSDPAVAHFRVWKGRL
jgi:hypothetical protein